MKPRIDSSGAAAAAVAAENDFIHLGRNKGQRQQQHAANEMHNQEYRIKAAVAASLFLIICN